MKDDQLNTLIVIEDEIAVRRSIIGKIRREKLPLMIQGEFQNAEEAYEELKKNPPEMVLLDMRMPGMGGMKFLEILSREFPEIQVIVLSGYSEFEYLQKAIKCGAKDYLLKPVVREDLKNALEKAIKNVSDIQQKKKKEEKLDLFLKNNVSLVKANLINKLIKGTEKFDITEDLKHFKEFSSCKTFLFVNGKIKNFTALKELSLNIYEKIEEMLTKSFEKLITLSNIGHTQNEDEFQCIVGFKETHDKIAHSHFKSKLEESLINVSDSENIVLHLSISNLYQDLLVTRNQYVETIFNTITLGSKPSLCTVDTNENLAEPILKQEEVEQMLCYVRGYNRKEIVLTVNKWFESLVKERKDLVFAQRLSFEILRSVEGAILNESNIDGLTSNYGMLTFYDFIKSYNNIEDIKYRIISSLITLSEKYEKKQNKPINDLILEAKQIIDEKFHGEITLESIASKLHINKSYLSELFKAEVGLTFNKYLNWVRIEKSKELLVVHDLNPSKIPELVGYKDYVYFSIVFKKFTGLPPGEFKQRNKGIS